MAKNREPMKAPPPEPETSEEEEEEGSSDDSVSQESDPETEQTQTQTPAKPNQPPAPQPKEPSSSSGEEESGSETESEPDEPTSKAKPLATKPVAEKQKANGGASNARSKPNAPDPVTPTKSAAAKRSAGDANSKDAKKLKADEAETSEKKSNLFQRLWSEEDEIAVLEGMIEYTSKKKADPVSDLSAFHDFIKEKLHIDASRTQLQDKIRRLKKKYENNKSKEKEGEDKIFSKPHEHKSYDLSKRIWGNQNIKENGGAKVVGSPKANGRVAKKTDGKKVNAAEREEANDAKNAMVVKEETLPAAKRLKSNSVGASVEERMLIAGQGLEGDEEWEKLKEEELELYLKQLEVKVAQTKLVLDAMKGRGH